MNKMNYQRQLEEIIRENERAGRVPSLFLHSCCAPCSSYVLEYLSSYFKITVFYYNPNIYPDEEYEKRVKEQERLTKEIPARYPVTFCSGPYDKDRFYDAVKGLEHTGEGHERCSACFRLRLSEAARLAADGGYDYYTTTLTISPMKDAQKLNEIGAQEGKKYGVKYLPSDFKKKNGYKRSTELSAMYGLYRQNYCGCVFSKQESLKRNETNESQKGE